MNKPPPEGIPAVVRHISQAARCEYILTEHHFLPGYITPRYIQSWSIQAADDLSIKVARATLFCTGHFVQKKN